MTPCFLSHRAAPIALDLRVTGLDHVYFSTLSLTISIALNLITLHSCIKSLLNFLSTTSCAGKGVTCRKCFNKVTVPLPYFASYISIAVEHFLVNKSRHIIYILDQVSITNTCDIIFCRPLEVRMVSMDF